MNSTVSCTTCQAAPECIIEDTRNGDILCTECGAIQSDHIIHDGQDWSNYPQDHSSFSKTNMSRVGQPESMNPFASLGTKVSKYKSKYAIQTEDGKYKLCDLSKTQIIVASNSRETSFNKIIGLFHELEVRYGIARSTTTLASLFWKQIAESKEIFKASNRDGLIAACLYHACLIKFPMPPKEIAKMMDVTERTLLEGDKILRNRLKLNTNPMLTMNYESKEFQDQRERQLLISYIERLNLEYKKYVPKCLELHTLMQDKLSRVGVSSALGGIIGYTVMYTYKLRKPSRKEIGQIVGISSPTLSKAVEIIKREING